MTTTPSALRRLVDQALSEHAGAPATAARTLQQAVAALPGEPGDVAHLLRAAEHILLGHLDDADALVHLLQQVAPHAEAAADAKQALQRARLAAALVEGLQPLGASDLAPADRIRALYNAALAHTRRAQWAEAQARVEAAGRLAEAADAAAQKAYAAITNNLAADMRDGLRDEHGGDASRVALMLDAACRARDAWSRAGGWLETERADYQLALCHAAAGQGERAIVHARQCLATCEAHGAHAFERLFAHEALARAHHSAGEDQVAQQHREHMAGFLTEIGDAELRGFAESALRELDADLSRDVLQ